MSETETKKANIKFHSPLPFIVKLRNLIFGKIFPDAYTQVTFYLSITIWFILFVWSCISYFVIVLRDFIYDQKGIQVETIVNARGEQLGFEAGEFLDRLLTFHLTSILCWLLVLIALVMLWRKNIKFIYFFLGGTLIYLAMILFYLNTLYFREDITFFDKIAFMALNANVLIYYFLLKREVKGGNISFFGEDEELE